jgi:3-mercaptopyruvate sulfurtransferase SseA
MIITQIDYKEKVKNILKGELKRRGITYEELAKRLTEIGVEENAHNLTNKIHRGVFSAIFFFQCMDVIGCKKIEIV